MKLKCRSGELIKRHINPELVFRRALTLTKFREDVSVERVLSYPIGPVPTSLFHDNVTMRKCNKSDLAKELEIVVGSVCSLPQFNSFSTVFIRDGINLIQSIDDRSISTFGGWCFDRYDKDESINLAEWTRWASASNSQIVYHLSEGRSISDWIKFISNSKNKHALITFLGEYITGARLPLLQLKVV